MTTFPEAPAVPTYGVDERLHRYQLATGVNRVLKGAVNNRVDITLTPSATSTVVTDARIGYFSHIEAMPLTASANTAKAAGIWFSNLAKGSATITHPSNAATDQTFRLSITG